MDYFVRLNVGVEDTALCVVDVDGAVLLQDGSSGIGFEIGVGVLDGGFGQMAIQVPDQVKKPETIARIINGE